MLFNGVDPCSIDRCISISREIPPGSATRKIRTLAARSGEVLTGVDYESGRYTVVFNIAARTLEAAKEMRVKLVEWAASSGEQTAMLLPSHNIDYYYNAILESVSEPEFGRGFYTIDVVFFLPRSFAVEYNGGWTRGGGGFAYLEMTHSVPIRPDITQTIEADCESVTWTLNDKSMLRMTGGFTAGQVINMNLEYEKLTLDGENAMHRIDPQQTRWQPGFRKGGNVLRSTDTGDIVARWKQECQ